MKLTIAVPSKGRISDPAVNILEKAGLGLKNATNRKLFASTYNKNIDVMFARAAEQIFLNSLKRVYATWEFQVLT